MAYRKIILASLLFVVQHTFAQLPAGVVKVTGFMQAVQMGNIPVDTDGRPMRNGTDTAYFIVVETKGKQLPEWKMAYTSNMVYTLSLSDSTKTDTDELVASRGQTMKAGKGNKLWKYVMDPSDLPKKCSAKSGQLLIEGKYNHRTFTLPLKTITTLAPEQRP